MDVDTSSRLYSKAVKKASVDLTTSVRRKLWRNIHIFHPNSAAQAKALDLKDLLHQYQHSLEIESSKEPPASNDSNRLLTLGQNLTFAPRLTYADQRLQYSHPGWANTESPHKLEPSLTATAQTDWFKQHLVCQDYYIREHVAPECVLSLRDRKQLIGYYKRLSLADKFAVPPAFCLHAQQAFSTESQVAQGLSPRSAPQAAVPTRKGRKND